MARFILDNKVFDTEKAEELCTFDKRWECSVCAGMMLKRTTTLYRTAKGNYFCVCNGDFSTLKAQLMEEAEAKQVLVRENYERYCELYEPLEEG